MYSLDIRSLDLSNSDESVLSTVAFIYVFSGVVYMYYLDTRSLDLSNSDMSVLSTVAVIYVFSGVVYICIL